jgi:hypothetical protein
MRKWTLTWELSVNMYSEVHYHCNSIVECITRWQDSHPHKDVRLIVSIQEVGS